MSEQRTPQQTITALRAGPGAGNEPPTVGEVRAASEKLPKSYAGALSALLYKLADSQLKSPGKNMVTRFEQFSRPWLSHLSDDRARFFSSYLDAFSQAVEAGLADLDWTDKDRARRIVERIAPNAPSADSVEGLAWLPIIGQLQSTYSRDAAAETLAPARTHPHSQLIADFYWDTGSLTYYSENEIRSARRPTPSLTSMRSTSVGGEAGSDKAIVISVDQNFFRIYGPMILFNAQQLPAIDFVLILCAPLEEAQRVLDEANQYLEALAAFNKQPAPVNVRFHVVDTPSWVANERTFYACARFLVMPELLQHYENLYAMDADLFMVRDPQQFMAATSNVTFGVPVTQGLLGVPPWRRYMAGNMLVNRGVLDSPVLDRLLDYVSVGLAEKSSWMLDQNAIAYAVEGARDGDVERLTNARPAVTGNFMKLWERGYKVANR